MKYTHAINAVALCLSVDSRSFARYNYDPEKSPKEEGLVLDTRHTKFVITDYKNNEVNTVVKMMQLAAEDGSETPITAKVTLDKIAENDNTFIQINAENSLSDTEVLVAALNHTGIVHWGSYIEILDDVRGYLKAYTDHPILVGSSNRFNNESVTFFVQTEDCVLIVQVKK